MITERELASAIAECEGQPSSYQLCEKLATFYTIADHMSRAQATQYAQEAAATESIIEGYGDTPFLRAITGRKAADVWPMMDELVTALQVLNPKLYESLAGRLGF